MCGHAGLTVGAGAVGEHVRRAGCPVDQTKPSSYETGTNKTAKKGDAYPAVVQKRDALSLETSTFGVARLRGTHCVFDGWMQKPTWAKAAKSATGRCAIVVTSFVEGITCRRPDDKVFFILALAIGDDSFVILTTDAKQTSLLGERARKSEGFGSGRCPLYADGAQAAGARRAPRRRRGGSRSAVAAEIEAAAQRRRQGGAGVGHRRGQARRRDAVADAGRRLRGAGGAQEEGQGGGGASGESWRGAASERSRRATCWRSRSRREKVPPDVRRARRRHRRLQGRKYANDPEDHERRSTSRSREEASPRRMRGARKSVGKAGSSRTD